MKQKEMDNIDVLLLQELVADSRQSLRSISRKLGIAVSTASSRLERLKGSGMIKGFSAEIDHEKMGYSLTAIITIRTRQAYTEEVEKAIADMKNSTAVYSVAGSFDAIVVAKFKNRNEMRAFIRDILKLEKVQRTETHIVMGTFKEKAGNWALA
ncbi:MAG: Lrp/AsnC family transcriptional regulator [Candidatus Diapherotrites archaeon]